MKKITLLFLIFFVCICVNAQNQLLSSKDQFLNTTTSIWEDIGGKNYEYDSSGRISTETFFAFSAGTVVPSKKSIYTYNTNSTVELFQEYNSSTSSFENFERTTKTFNSSGLTVSILDETFDGALWVNEFRITFNYTGGLLTDALGEEWDGSAWEPIETFNVIYNTNNKVERIDTNDTDGTITEPVERREFTYDANGFIETDVLSEWDTTSYIESERTTYTVDNNGNRLSEIFADAFSSTSNTNTYDYDFTQLMSDFDNPFDNSTLNSLTEDFPHFNKVTQENTGDNQRTIYDYNNALVLSNSEFTLNSKINVYPNPTSNILNIESVKDINTIEFFNISGKRVLVSSKRQIDVSHLKSGIYMVRISSLNNQVETKKIIKN
ncbi:T9SS type A sorting domain-containing protein [uncultured Algibacter sp.]|uniref:T9SS type A sorting domain-containing protein n=1 Tax=uncultured Algibacter sp. TaxID=298659 RepID=UPI0032177439